MPWYLQQRRLVIEGLELRGTAGLVQEDHALRRRCEVRQPRKPAGLRIAPLVETCGEDLRTEQRRERANADPLRRPPEELPPRQVKIDLLFDVHGCTGVRSHTGSDLYFPMLQICIWFF